MALTARQLAWVKRLRRLARVLAVAAWLPLVAEWATIAVPAGRRSSGSGLLAGPAWPFELVVVTIPLTLLLCVLGLACALVVGERRATLLAGGALLALVLTVVVAAAVSDSVDWRAAGAATFTPVQELLP